MRLSRRPALRGTTPRTPRTPRTALTALTTLGTAVALGVVALPGTTAYADQGAGPGGPAAGSAATGGDQREVSPSTLMPGKVPLRAGTRRQNVPRVNPNAPAQDSTVGDQKTWLTLDDTQGDYLPQAFTLRGLGSHIQVWVANDRSFPAGDCRNTMGQTDVTDAQVSDFVSQFDTNIYPKESSAFSVPVSRDGTQADPSLPDATYRVQADQADDIVVLVDNVRDSNYYAPTSADGQTYIAGFFSPGFTQLFDRNIMTVDAFDWLHRTGATPPDDRNNPAYQACAAQLKASRPLGAPHPRDYEATFAHEYQHLLENDQDADETTWVNEGLSDWAQTLVGYVDNNVSPDGDTSVVDSHYQCITGYQPPAFGGPENSLTRWSDQGDPEILCDYGATYTFMEYLASHYGTAFMSALHTQPANGLVGLQRVLTQFKVGVRAQEVVHRWAAMLALDQSLDHNGGRLTGGSASAYSASSLDSKINWANPQAYNSPGAPANGSDYVRLRKNGYLPSNRISAVTFKGASTLKPDKVAWKVDAAPPASTTTATTCGAVTKGPKPKALYSGCGPDLDRSIVRSVRVPEKKAAATLTFKTLYDIEEGFDIGAVTVSKDNGRTWKSLPTADTVGSAAFADGDPAIAKTAPGFSGDSKTWRSETASLRAYAGRSVLVGFRYRTDPGVDEAGFWVKNVKVGGTTLPTGTLKGWRTYEQVRPTRVAGWTVQLVGYNATGPAHVLRMRIGRGFTGRLTGAQVRRAMGPRTSLVSAIVTYDDPSETSTENARYTLRVNQRLQPGG